MVREAWHVVIPPPPAEEGDDTIHGGQVAPLAGSGFHAPYQLGGIA